MRPYMSIDIETTGIDDRSEILQIAAIIDDGSDLSQLKTLDMPIKHKSIDYSEPYALGMNADLLKKMMDKEFVTYTPQLAIESLLVFMETMNATYIDDKNKPIKIMFAGKNVASFDIPKIRLFIQKHGELNNPLLRGSRSLERFDKITHYKTLDVGSLYFDTFQDNVSLSKINELTGRSEVSHNAMDDAMDVVYAVRYKLNNK